MTTGDKHPYNIDMIEKYPKVYIRYMLYEH